MKINNFQICVGNASCNARCKYCISRMTYNMKNNEYEYQDRDFRKIKQLAQKFGITTAILTGKGEPTLVHPMIIESIIRRLSDGFPIIELLTNGHNVKSSNVDAFYHKGLTTLCISRGHYDDTKNTELMGIKQDLTKFESVSVPICKRIATTLCKGYIDSPEEVDKMIDYVKSLSFEQLTLHPIGLPQTVRNDTVGKFVEEHQLEIYQYANIHCYLKRTGKLIYKFPWGGEMYDVKGITIVMGFCLDNDDNREKGQFHSLIYGTDGRVRLSWEHEGSVIM